MLRRMLKPHATLARFRLSASACLHCLPSQRVRKLSASTPALPERSRISTRYAIDTSTSAPWVGLHTMFCIHYVVFMIFTI